MTAGDALAEAIDEAERARNPEVAGSEWRPAFKPTPADQSDFDVAMAWWTALNPPELWHNSREAWAINMQQKVLLWRSIPLPMSFAEIAVKHRMTRQRVNFLYHDGLEKCFRAANGLRVHRHVIVRDRLADVREGNRAAKRLRTDDGPRVMDRVQESDPLDEISGGPSHAARQSR